MANLLIVDDDLDMADVCAEILRGEGHVVRYARNGAEGLSLVGQMITDLILCDASARGAHCTHPRV